MTATRFATGRCPVWPESLGRFAPEPVITLTGISTRKMEIPGFVPDAG